MRALVVTDPFDGYAVGDRIEARDEIARIEGGANAVRTVVVNTPEPAPKKAKGKDEPDA